MNFKIFEQIVELPENEGIFSLSNKTGESLFVGVAENIKREAEKTLAKNEFLKSQTVYIETTDGSGKDLIKLYGQTLRRKNPLYNVSLNQQNLYPHLKITREDFPRLFVTRRIEEDEAEYFGAFLPETGVRFLLGFINRMFRPRGCDIPIDGSFSVPCPEFYRKRCVAPCVDDLCDKESYLEAIKLLKLFLQKKPDELDLKLLEKIRLASDDLDFKRAAKWRDFSQTISQFVNDKARNYWLEDTVDTYEIKETASGLLIHLVTQRKRKTLGRRTFTYENKIGFSPKEIISQLLWQFYQFHAPAKIFVPSDFPHRKFLEETFNRRDGGDEKFEILVLKKNIQKKTVKRALHFTEFKYELENIKPKTSLTNVQNELKLKFNLKKKPDRIEAFDVAHISGTDFVGAKSVWTAGKFVAEENEFWFLDVKNELEALAKTIENRFIKKEELPDLILIDGGKSQLLAALKPLQKQNNIEFAVVSAVKPPHRHNEISHFLLESGQVLTFNRTLDAFQILLKLRDEAHALANYVHRTKREMAHFYEVFAALTILKQNERQNLLKNFGSLNDVKKASEKELKEFLGSIKGKMVFNELQKEHGKTEPFIVPIRFDDPNGDAADLQPLSLPETFYKNNGNFGGGDRNRTDE